MLAFEKPIFAIQNENFNSSSNSDIKCPECGAAAVFAWPDFVCQNCGLVLDEVEFEHFDDYSFNHPTLINLNNELLSMTHSSFKNKNKKNETKDGKGVQLKTSAKKRFKRLFHIDKISKYLNNNNRKEEYSLDVLNLTRINIRKIEFFHSYPFFVFRRMEYIYKKIEKNFSKEDFGRDKQNHLQIALYSLYISCKEFDIETGKQPISIKRFLEEINDIYKQNSFSFKVFQVIHSVVKDFLSSELKIREDVISPVGLHRRINLQNKDDFIAFREKIKQLNQKLINSNEVGQFLKRLYPNHPLISLKTAAENYFKIINEVLIFLIRDIRKKAPIFNGNLDKVAFSFIFYSIKILSILTAEKMNEKKRNYLRSDSFRHWHQIRIIPQTLIFKICDLPISRKVITRYYTFNQISGVKNTEKHLEGVRKWLKKKNIKLPTPRLS